MRYIHWNNLAQEDYHAIIDYLLNHWSSRKAQEFIDETDRILYILSKGNVEFQKTNLPDIRRCVIKSQVTLFYKEIDQNNIELLRFWNNFQNDSKRSF